MRDEIIKSIDIVDEVITESEIDVCLSLLESYAKMSVIIENYDGPVNELDIFQEGFGDDVKKSMDETGQNRSTLFKILTIIPRLIHAIMTAIRNKFLKISESAEKTGKEFTEKFAKATEEQKKKIVGMFDPDKEKRKKIIIGSAVAASGAVLTAASIAKIKERQAKKLEELHAANMKEIHTMLEKCVEEELSGDIGKEYKNTMNAYKSRHTTNEQRGQLRNLLDSYHNTYNMYYTNLRETITNCLKTTPEHANIDPEDPTTRYEEDLMSCLEIIEPIGRIVSSTRPEELDKLEERLKNETLEGDVRPVGGAYEDYSSGQYVSEPTEIKDISKRLQAEIEFIYKNDKHCEPVTMRPDGTLGIPCLVARDVIVIQACVKGLKYLTERLKQNESNASVRNYPDKKEKSVFVKILTEGKNIKAPIYSASGYMENTKNAFKQFEEIEKEIYNTINEAKDILNTLGLEDLKNDLNAFGPKESIGTEKVSKTTFEEMTKLIDLLRHYSSQVNHDMEIYDHTRKAIGYINEFYLQK